MLRLDCYTSLIPFIKEHKETENACAQPVRNFFSLPSCYWWCKICCILPKMSYKESTLCKEGIILEIQGLMLQETTEIKLLEINSFCKYCQEQLMKMISNWPCLLCFHTWDVRVLHPKLSFPFEQTRNLKREAAPHTWCGNMLETYWTLNLILCKKKKKGQAK